MMRLKIGLFIFVISVPLLLQAQSIKPFETYDHYKYDQGQTLNVYAENGKLALTVLKPNVIKISYLVGDVANAELLNNDIFKFQKSFVRVTQNLDNIYMLTDSLLIVINKWDFSIRFETRREQLFAKINKPDFENSSNILSFQTANQENFYNRKGCILNKENLKDKRTNLLFSDKNYGILFPEKIKVTYQKGEISVSANKKDDLEYVFIKGSKKELLKLKKEVYR